MTTSNKEWQELLDAACFRVALTDVFVDNPSRRAKRYRAVLPVGTDNRAEPFAIVTDRYRLIRNEDIIDLGHEAFERLFGSHARTQLTVFNVVLAPKRGSFFADFTSPELNCTIPIPGRHGSTVAEGDPSLHGFFLRVVNSYNRTQAVRLEAGICRWICRNGMIFGKQSIQFRAPHHKTKQQLMDQIARDAQRLSTDQLSEQMGKAYGIRLNAGMDVLEGVWQTLRLAIPPVDPDSRTAPMWRVRCAALCVVASKYENEHPPNAFSVLQAASQWAHEAARTSPIQRHSYERRCGEMLAQLTANARWPVRDQQARDQVARIRDWADVPLKPT